MQAHTKEYLSGAGYCEVDFIPCEICENKAQDVHHVNARGSGGNPDQHQQLAGAKALPPGRPGAGRRFPGHHLRPHQDAGALPGGGDGHLPRPPRAGGAGDVRQGRQALSGQGFFLPL